VTETMPEPNELVVGKDGAPKAGQDKSGNEGDMDMDSVSVVKEKSATKEGEEPKDEPTQLAKDLHRLLLETTIQSGALVCANCGHEYAIKEGIANFLLPSHLV